MMIKRAIIGLAAVVCVAMFLSACGSKSSKQSCTLSSDCPVAKMCQTNVCVDRPTCTVTCEGNAQCINGICMDCVPEEGCTEAKTVCNQDFVCVYEKCNGEATCSNHGTCSDSDGPFVCTCDTANGYTGDRCDQCEDGYQNVSGVCILNVSCQGQAQGAECDPDGTGGTTFQQADGQCTKGGTCLRKNCLTCAADNDCYGGHCVCADDTCSTYQCYSDTAPRCEHVSGTKDNCVLVPKTQGSDCGVCCKCDDVGGAQKDLDNQNGDCTGYTAYNPCSNRCVNVDTCGIPVAAACGSGGCIGTCSEKGQCSTNTKACGCGLVIDYGKCLYGTCFSSKGCAYCSGTRGVAECGSLRCCKLTDPNYCDAYCFIIIRPISTINLFEE
jgi:hypothetical protein